jgi:heptosyltransferase-3
MIIPNWLITAVRRRRDRRILNPQEHDVIKRYQRRLRVHTLAAALIDSLLRTFLTTAAPGGIRLPRRILLANLGGLGDVVLSTAALGIVRKALPQAEIGFLLGSWARPVLENHPSIRHFHILNHWQIERTGEPFRVRLPRYIRATSATVRELREMGYDVAVDLRAWWPNSAYVVWRAGIPVRIGYPCAGLGPLLTHPVRFQYRRLHESRIQWELLRALSIPDELFVDEPPFDMPLGTEGAQKEACDLLRAAGIDGHPYRILHVGASAVARDWPMENWRRLAGRLVDEGHRLVFTGRGPRDRKQIDSIILGLSGCVNACDRLSWAGLVALIRGAELVYSVETMAGHIAVAVNTPCVGVYGGMSDVLQWSPRPSSTSVCVTQWVPCSPCFVFNGCALKSCIRGLDIETVYVAGERLAGLRTQD